MIANISPASACLAETLSTLRFAQRAKDIRNKVGSAALLYHDVEYIQWILCFKFSTVRPVLDLL